MTPIRMVGTVESIEGELVDVTALGEDEPRFVPAYQSAVVRTRYGTFSVTRGDLDIADRLVITIEREAK